MLKSSVHKQLEFWILKKPDEFSAGYFKAFICHEMMQTIGINMDVKQPMLDNEFSIESMKC